MLRTCVLLYALILGAKAFTIYNTQHSLCLEEAHVTGLVVLKRCNLYSGSQQWTWSDEGTLVSVASSRCLSASQNEPVKTVSCEEQGADEAQLMWDCVRDGLFSRSTSMLLSVDGQQVTLAHGGKSSRWKSLEKGDICQEKLERSRRSSDYPEGEDEQTGKEAQMTEEQREYLRWYYRTEDPTIWKFVLLGVAFVCLLVGFLLLGMGAMANKNRSEIAKYKAAAAKAQKSEGEELLVVSTARDCGNDKPLASLDSTMQEEDKSSPSNGEVSEPKAGDIVVTWKDGNTSSLYPETVADDLKPSETSADEDTEMTGLVHLDHLGGAN